VGKEKEGGTKNNCCQEIKFYEGKRKESEQKKKSRKARNNKPSMARGRWGSLAGGKCGSDD
jgi:hypothetical protein